MSREVVALHGDRPPPVAIVDSSKVYRKRFKRDFKPSRWEHVDFANSARDDGLLLKHWRKKKTAPPPAQVTNDVNGDIMEIDSQPVLGPTPTDYEFAKFNVEITVPTFTDEQYERFLVDRTGDWSQEETEYLLDVIKTYHQKWPVIYDRYEWKVTVPQSTVEGEEKNATVAAPVRERSMEEMKARYYFICAKSMEFSLPNGVAGMNTEEFALHDQYTKFNPELERRRKQLAWALCLREEKDIREEEFLLSELQRIMISAQKFETERAELRQRLEIAPTLSSGNGLSMPLSSATLNGLFNQLQAQDRNRKPRARVSLDNIQTGANVPGGLTTPASAGGHRDSLGSGNKRASLTAQTPIRTIGPRDEQRYGVTTHDRLTSGVTFRTEKIQKLRQAKSNIQTQKIHQMLVELELPEILPLLTTRVMETYETLIANINRLTDARKVLAKEEQELMTARNLKEEIDRQTGSGSGDVKLQNAKVEEGDVDAEGEEEEDDDDAEGEDVEMASPPAEEPESTRPSSSRSNAGFKRSTRSASILSTSSRASRRRK
jgi:DNA methyltransferase 1-associated protein 1